MAVASLVLGIISLICWFFSATVIGAIAGMIIGIIGTILGVMAKNKIKQEQIQWHQRQQQGIPQTSGQIQPPSTGMATAGMVLSIIGLVLNSLGFIGCAACVGALSSMS